jgi:hypothetical protein
MNYRRHLPTIKYNRPPEETRDSFAVTYGVTEGLFKLIGWCIILGTLHYGYIKTQSNWFFLPESGLTGLLAYLAYTWFMRFTVTLPSGHTVAFHDGRPKPFHWPSFVAMFVVMGGVRLMIYHWVGAVAALQTK